MDSFNDSMTPGHGVASCIGIMAVHKQSSVSDSNGLNN
jgi:hypothetical protein